MKRLTAPLACIATVASLAIAVGLRMDGPTVAEAKLDHVLVGVCTNVVDGDTCDIADGRETYRVRLRGIDAPEIKQPFGTAAQGYLAQRIERRQVQVVWRKREKYGRILGDVYLGDSHLNREMIEVGLAWRYYEQNAEWDELQTKAKKLMMGLWSDGGAIEPSKWRAGQRTNQHN